ncbi:MAG: ATP-binding protein [Acidobacteriota bacterium]
MPVRDVVRIDETLCDGCGECVPSCAEGAIALVDGKARLISEALCDGVGACLGHCPKGAISVVNAEAGPFDRGAATAPGTATAADRPLPRVDVPVRTDPVARSEAVGCPGARPTSWGSSPGPATGRQPSAASRLRQWPVQLHLLSPAAPFLRAAHMLLAADCVGYAVGDFHTSLLAGRSLAVACPKLDGGQDRYLDTLVALIDRAEIASLTVAVMEVPCCAGLVRLAHAAARRAHREVPLRVVVIDIRGTILGEHVLVSPQEPLAPNAAGSPVA